MTRRLPSITCMQTPLCSHASEIPTGMVDYLSLALVLAFLGLGFVAIALKQWFNNVLQVTRDLLEKQGVYITSHGVTVKTNKPYDHEQYFDNIQRKLVKFLNASLYERKKLLTDLVAHSYPAPQVPGRRKGPKATPRPAQSQ